jgi:RHS repeat-associated protein
MYPALSARIPDGLLAAMPQLREKPHQGVPSKNPAWNPGPNVCNSTVAIGLRAGLALERVRSRSTGKERDTESGNDYFGARYYASSMGRFLSPDPATNLSRILANPQRWNRYAYVVNNPLIRLDPDGAEDVYVTVWRDTSTQHSTTGRIDMRGGNGRTLSGKYLEPEIKGAGGIHPKGRISEGEYSASFHASLNTHPVPALFLLEGVPGFTGVNFHNGNKPSDTEGCFLYGTALGTDWVSGSGAFRSKAMNFLNDVAGDDGTTVQDLTIHVSIPLGNIDTFTPPEPFGSGNSTTMAAPPPGIPGTGHWDPSAGTPGNPMGWTPNPPPDWKREIPGWH